MEENPKHSAEWLEMKTELTSTDKQEREWSDDERLKRISAVAFCLRSRRKMFRSRPANSEKKKKTGRINN